MSKSRFSLITKVGISISLLLMISVFGLILISKEWLPIKGAMDSGFNSNHQRSMELTFFYPSLSPKITTDILEIETYSNNLVVAPTIGTLVTYFSDERPVPYLAKSWHKDGLRWVFEIREGLRCENGEEITAQGFVKSLSKSIRLYSKWNDHPIFKYLSGYEQLLKDHAGEFDGIRANGNQLIFTFIKNVRGGFLEHLTMAPFGFICEDNYDGDGWKDSSRIISSGPYTLESIRTQESYRLRRRDDWPLGIQGDFQNITILRKGLEDFRGHQGTKIIEVQNPPAGDLSSYKNIRQIPQNLIVVKLNVHRGPFKDRVNRIRFLESFRRHLNDFKFESNSVFKTEHFFASDNSILKPLDKVSIADKKKPMNLLMKVMLKGPNTPNDINKEIAQKVGEELGWAIKFDSEPYESFRKTFNDPKYDIYVQAAEIGGGFEGWVIDMLFCSDVGDRWPDPSGRICQLTKEFDSSDLSEHEASQRFHNYLIEDAALIPTFHRGGFYLFSEDIDIKSLSPIATRIRFEEIKASK